MARTSVQMAGSSAAPLIVDNPPEPGGGRAAAVRRYALGQILGVWAAAALPMGVLAWVVAPWLRDRLGGDAPLAQALLICITAGLVWQFVLVLVGAIWVGLDGCAYARACGCGHPAIRGVAAWGGTALVVGTPLRGPCGPRRAPAEYPWTGGAGSRRVPGLGRWQGLRQRRMRLVRGVRGARRRQHGAGRGVVVPWAAAAADTGCLWAVGLGSQRSSVRALPSACAVGHPPTLVDTVAFAYPSRRFQSAWMGIAVHSTQSVFFIAVVLAVVLA